MEAHNPDSQYYDYDECDDISIEENKQTISSKNSSSHKKLEYNENDPSV